MLAAMALFPHRCSLASAVLTVAALLALTPPPLGGQSPVLLPRDHWAVRALRTLDALGVLREPLDLGRRRPTVGEADRLLRTADPRGSPEADALLAAYRARFHDEVRRRADPGAEDLWWAGAVGPALVVRENEFGTRSGRLVLGPDGEFGLTGEAPGPRRPDDVRLEPSGWAAAGAGRLGAGAAARLTGTGDGVYEGHVGVRLGRVAFWGGRAAVGYGPAPHGTQVLSGDRVILGGGFSTVRPFRLPWVLRRLGSFHVESQLGTVDRSGDIDDPWLWGLRLAAMPHPRVGFGVSRAAMFGGRGNGGFDLGHLLEIVVLERQPGVPFENQVGAVDAWFRPPLGRMPVTIWAEWGSDDTAGAWFQVPALATGVEVATWPGLPALGLAMEATWFFEACCGNGPWYLHGFFPSGWAVEGRPLGHPLGGEGSELLVGFDVRPGTAPAEVSLELFRRDRLGFNLYAPRWEGVSYGAEIQAFARRGRWELALEGYAEDGTTWRRAGGAIATRVRF